MFPFVLQITSMIPHIRYGLRIGADVICEKPLVLNPWNVDALIELEESIKIRYIPFST